MSLGQPLTTPAGVAHYRDTPNYDARMEPVINVDGYQRCRSILCQQLIPKAVAHVTSGLCMDCFTAGPGAIVDEVSLAAGRHSTFHVKAAGKPWPAKKETAKRRERVAKKSTAKQRAKARLTQMFPDEYQIVLAEERFKLGLGLPALRPGTREFAETLKTYRPPEMYALARNPGEPPDGA